MKANAAHMAFRADMISLLAKHAGHLNAASMLAVSSHLVGQIIAMQDQRTMTGQRSLEIVMENIEQGNREAIDKLLSPVGRG